MLPTFAWIIENVILFNKQIILIYYFGICWLCSSEIFLCYGQLWEGLNWPYPHFATGLHAANLWRVIWSKNRRLPKIRDYNTPIRPLYVYLFIQITILLTCIHCNTYLISLVPTLDLSVGVLTAYRYISIKYCSLTKSFSPKINLTRKYLTKYDWVWKLFCEIKS